MRKVHQAGGILTHADLKHYDVRVERSLEGTYRGRRVYTSNAPTSGPVLLHMLNLMEHYDLIEEGRTELNLHRMVEAIKCKHCFGNDLIVHYTSYTVGFAAR